MSIPQPLRLSACVLMLPLSSFGCMSKLSVIAGTTAISASQSKKASAAAQGITKLVAATTFGSITCKAGDTDRVDMTAEVTATGPYSKEVLNSWLDKATVSLWRDGNNLQPLLTAPPNMPKDLSMFASYTLTTPKGLTLDLKSDNGSIDSRGPSGPVDAKSSFGGVDVRGVNGNVQAHSDNGSVGVSDVSGDVDAGSKFGEVRLKSVRGRVTARSDNGAVSAADVGGDTEAKSSFGEIRLSNIRGRVIGQSDNGSVTAHEVHAEGKDAKLRSSFGEVRFDGAADSLTMHSDNGSLTARPQPAPKDTDISSSFGAITLELPATTDADIDARTGFGSIEARGFPAPPGGDNKSWTARIGKGGPRIKLTTDNGSITVKAR